MILDGLLQFSSAQSLAQAVGAYDSTNTIDLGVNGLPTSAAGGGARDIGIGEHPVPKVFAALATALAGAGASIQVAVMGAPDNGNGAPGAFYDMALSPVYAAPLNPANRLINIDFPRVPLGQVPPRFVKLQYRITGAAITGGAVNAYVVLDIPNRIQGPTGLDSGYPAGINIAN